MTGERLLNNEQAKEPSHSSGRSQPPVWDNLCLNLLHKDTSNAYRAQKFLTLVVLIFQPCYIRI